MPEKNKQVVKYTSVTFTASPVVGGHAFVVPVDHPDTVFVKNGHEAFTSQIVSYDETTEQFETLYTLYVPA